MKDNYILGLFLGLIIVIFTSCLKLTTLETQEEMMISSSSYVEKKDALVSLKVVNNTQNVYLQIDNCELCNVYGEYIYGDELETYSEGNIINVNMISDSLILHPQDTLYTESIKLATQGLKAWDCIHVPEFNDGTYIKIDGHLFMKDSNIKMEIGNGSFYIPVKGVLLNYKNNIIGLTLENQCPWYYESSNGEMVRALEAISFSVSVKDWETVEHVSVGL